MTWDYIIIGAGSAGCALAQQLATSGRNETVLVLEAGGSDRSASIKIPAGVVRAMTRFDWGYRAEPDPSRNGTREEWLRGKVLGGSSSINGTIYVRGAAEDFDRWSRVCGHGGGWSAGEIMPLFREMETSDQMGPLRGRTGPLYVRTVKRPHRISQAFVRSAQAAGLPFNEDYNGASQEGVSYVQLTQRGGLRWSSADAFLKPVLGRKNLTLLLNAAVERIEVVNGRAVAVSFYHRGAKHREEARDIILCAGAINSPKLLMLSGIGDAQELKKRNVDVVIDLPGVGRNLRDHPLVRLPYRVKIPTDNPTQGLWQKLRIVARFIGWHEGPVSNLFEGAGFLKSSNSQTAPDIQIFFASAGYLALPNGEVKLATYPSVTLIAAHSYPSGSGRVRLSSNNAADAPLIEYSLLDNRADIDALAGGVEAIRRIMNTEPIASLAEEEVPQIAKIAGVSELESFIRGNASICFHSIGTCRMGVGADAVVDPDLRVRGTENLWVADASIMPDPISANTNAACMMIGMKLGKQLAARQ